MNVFIVKVEIEQKIQDLVILRDTFGEAEQHAKWLSDNVISITKIASSQKQKVMTSDAVIDILLADHKWREHV